MGKGESLQSGCVVCLINRKESTVKQVASYTAHALSVLSGVSVRTLHYYDELGLLQPRRAGNNYRVYTDAEIDRLQQ
ncbi:MAG: MerR family DNA-binding transcriptional regulator, partial [Raoultibacter sp.]